MGFSDAFKILIRQSWNAFPLRESDTKFSSHKKLLQNSCLPFQISCHSQMLSSKMTCLFAPDIFSTWNFSFYVISRWFCKRKRLVLLFKRQKQQHTHPVHFITLQGPAAYHWMWQVCKPQTDAAAEFGRSNWTQSCVILMSLLMANQ